MPPMPETLAELRAVSRRFGPVTAVEPLDLALDAGDILGLLGPNGAGKTTTLRMLTGNLAPSTGEIRIGGHDLLSDPVAAKHLLGYLPEQPPLYRELRVEEYLDHCARLHRVARGDRAQAVQRAIERCQLGDVRRQLVGTLSKGYQQRVGLGQAIIHQPRVLVLDEPTVGLDPNQIREIRALIGDLGRDCAVILSTHALSEVEAICSRVAILDHGRLLLAGELAAVLAKLGGTRLRVRFRGLPSPGLLESVPGVTEVRRESDQSFCITHAQDQDPTETIVALAQTHGLGLLEIGPEQGSLEQLFVRLTAAPEETLA